MPSTKGKSIEAQGTRTGVGQLAPSSPARESRGMLKLYNWWQQIQWFSWESM